MGHERTISVPDKILFLAGAHLKIGKPSNILDSEQNLVMEHYNFCISFLSLDFKNALKTSLKKYELKF